MKFCTATFALALALAAIVCSATNVPDEISPKHFIEELTKKQKHCIFSVYDDTSCAVMAAMDVCDKFDGGKIRLLSQTM
jgi:hypothetical protein